MARPNLAAMITACSFRTGNTPGKPKSTSHAWVFGSAPKVVEALETAKETKGIPTVIIAKTTKGKGVSYMENVPKWHGEAPCDEEALIALNDIMGVAA